MLKTHHKMRGWNREFQYLPAKIIGEIVKYQYLPAKTIHFSLSHLTLSSLSHIPLSPLFHTKEVLRWTMQLRQALSFRTRVHTYYRDPRIRVHTYYRDPSTKCVFSYFFEQRGARASGRLDHGLGTPPTRLEAAQKAGYHTLAALFHEPGHTCLLLL